jgi:hypothetical protein
LLKQNYNALTFPIASSLLDIFPTNTTRSQNSGRTKGKVCTGYRRRRYLATATRW